MPYRGRTTSKSVKPSSGKTVHSIFTDWIKKGAPIGKATYPPKGKTYLRGRLVNMPKK